MGARADFSRRLEATGFVRLQGALSVAGPNPNDRNLDDTARDLNSARTFAQLEIASAPLERLELFAKLRAFGEQAADLDRRVEPFDAFPDLSGGGGRALRIAGDGAAAEVWELYADVRLPPFSLRLGRQQVVWGETLGRRLLDVVNPLDLSGHLFLEPYVEEFDNLRIPQWLVRATAPLPNPWLAALAVEAIAGPGDGATTRLPARGSPYAIVPSWVTIVDDEPIGRPVAGGRVLFEIAGAVVSLAYLTKPADDAIAVFRAAVFDPRTGLPVSPAPGADPVPLRFVNDGRHPRLHLVGGSASRFLEALGAVLRFEATWTPDQPYQREPAPAARVVTGIARRSTWRHAVVVDRPTAILPGQDPTTILGVTFFQTIVDGAPGGILASGAPVDAASSQLTLTLSQPFLRKTAAVDLLWSWDPDGAYWLQPGVRLIRGDHWRIDAYANVLGGGERRPGRLGSLGFADEAVLRVTYGF